MIIQNIQNIIAAITLVLGLVVSWLIVKTMRLDSIRKHFYSSGLRRNLEDTLVAQDQEINNLKASVRDLNNQTENLRVINKNNFQKIGMVRFSQHAEAGNLSFAVVILNAHNTGVAISSLHGREGCRVYSKDIINGKSKGKLTIEETEALAQAMNSNQL